MEFEFGSMWFERFEIALGDKNRKNLLWVCERLDASCCYEWFCLLVSELTVRQIHSYQHPSGSHTQRTINHRYAQKPFCAQDKQNSFTCMMVLYFQQCSTLHRENHFREQAAENCFFFVYRPCFCLKPNIKPSRTLSNQTQIHPNSLKL